MARLGEKSGNVIGGVLAIAIHGQRPDETAINGPAQTGMQRGSFAEGGCVTNDFSAGCLGGRRSLIRRAIVNNDDVRDLPAHRADQRSDCEFLIEARNDDDTFRGPLHVAKL
jgi:hypothetical protein